MVSQKVYGTDLLQKLLIGNLEFYKFCSCDQPEDSEKYCFVHSKVIPHKSYFICLLLSLLTSSVPNTKMLSIKTISWWLVNLCVFLLFSWPTDSVNSIFFEFCYEVCATARGVLRGVWAMNSTAGCQKTPSKAKSDHNTPSHDLQKSNKSKQWAYTYNVNVSEHAVLWTFCVLIFFSYKPCTSVLPVTSPSPIRISYRSPESFLLLISETRKCFQAYCRGIINSKNWPVGMHSRLGDRWRLTGDIKTSETLAPIKAY